MRKTLSKFPQYGLLGIITLGLLYGCGGGGSGGGGGNNTSGGVTYNGNTDPAEITSANSKEMANSTLNASDNGAFGGLSANSQNAVRNIRASAHIAAQKLIDIQKFVNGQRSIQGQARPMEVQDCDSGTMDITDTAVEFDNCRLGDITFDGGFSISGTESNATFSYDNLRITGPGLDIEFGGTAVFVSSGNTETITMNTVFIDRVEGVTFRTDDYVIVITENNDGTITETINGRVYHSDYGYVDITTTTPIFYDSEFASYPSAGQIVVEGNSNSKIRMTVLSSTQIQVELDEDGDGVYECDSGPLNWSDLDSEDDLVCI